MTPGESQPARRHRRLNAIDQCILSINDSMQRLNNPGFETLGLLWMDGRLDVPRLHAALAKLRRRHPILTARLRERSGGIRCWGWHAEEEIPLDERSLTSSDEAVVLEAAADILSVRRDLRRDRGLAFHLLRLPDQSDVLLLHFNHALMDHQSGTLLLQELSQLYCGQPLPAPGTDHDRVEEYRRRFSRRQRLRAFFRAIPDFIRDRWLPRKRWPRMLSPARGWALREPARLRILSRQLAPEEVEGLLNYARRISRFPSTSLTILGSVFRAFAGQVPEPRPDDLFRTGIGVEVVPQEGEDFHPQNASSVLRLEIRRGELADRARAVTLLHNRLLQELKEQRDLGIVEANSLFSRCYPMVRRISGQMVRWAFSFWYAFFSVSSELSRSFAGIPLRQVRYLGPAWSPPGMTLLATHFQDRIFLDLTYVEQRIPREKAEQVLDDLMDDLRAALRETEAGATAEAGRG